MTNTGLCYYEKMCDSYSVCFKIILSPQLQIHSNMIQMVADLRQHNRSEKKNFEPSILDVWKDVIQVQHEL